MLMDAMINNFIEFEKTRSKKYTDVYNNYIDTLSTDSSQRAKLIAKYAANISTGHFDRNLGDLAISLAGR